MQQTVQSEQAHLSQLSHSLYKLTDGLLVTVVRLLLLTDIHKCIGKWWWCGGWLWGVLCEEPAVVAVAAAHAPKCSSKGWWIALWVVEAAVAATADVPTLWWWWWWWWDNGQGIGVGLEAGLLAAVAACIAAIAAAGDNKGWCSGLVCEWCEVEVALFIKLVFVTAALLITAACCVKWCNKFGKLPVGYGRPKLG